MRNNGGKEAVARPRIGLEWSRPRTLKARRRRRGGIDISMLGMTGGARPGTCGSGRNAHGICRCPLAAGCSCRATWTRQPSQNGPPGGLGWSRAAADAPPWAVGGFRAHLSSQQVGRPYPRSRDRRPSRWRCSLAPSPGAVGQSHARDAAAATTCRAAGTSDKPAHSLSPARSNGGAAGVEGLLQSHRLRGLPRRRFKAPRPPHPLLLRGRRHHEPAAGATSGPPTP
jgi:hypothetical protein